jgi:carbon-monoxide dehydrogenase medium subunit
VEAIETIASYQLRNRATMGGNLANASPAADTAPAALVLEATLVIMGPGGERKIPVGEFFKGPGETVLEGDEILASIEFPIPETDLIGRYIKLGRNAEGDLAIAGVAVVGFPDKGSASGYQFRIALASVAPTPIRVPKAEAILGDGAISNERINLAALATEDAASPIDDIRASAQYRKAMVRELSLQAFSDVWTQLQKEA